MSKKFKDLDLSNAFLFAATMSDPDTCKLVLEIILGEELPPLTVHTEHTVLISSDLRAVRFDVYATDELQVNYNIEAQNYDEKNLPKRSRFHQAEIDVASIKPGQRFEDLKPVYVIFVCTFDPFGQGLYRYTFENTCQESGIPLGDEAKRIFLSTKGRNVDEVPKELIHFLNYMQQSTDAYVADVNDTNISRLHEQVKRVKRKAGMEEMFMTGAELLEISEARGRAQSVIVILSEYGSVPKDIEQKIMSEREQEVLIGWTKLAARVSSVEEFAEKM